MAYHQSAKVQDQPCTQIKELKGVECSSCANKVEGAACAFKGVRRYANSAVVGKFASIFSFPILSYCMYMLKLHASCLSQY